MSYLTPLYALSKRNLILRYKHSFLGFLWGFLKPLLYLLIFLIVFGSQFTSTNDHILYITSGIIFWFFFANATTQGTHSIVQAAGLIKSIKLPTHFFPLAEIVSEFINLFMALAVYFCLMPAFGLQFNVHFFWLVPIVIVFAWFTYSVTLLLSCLHVNYRDVGLLWTTLQPALFYLTPIAFTEEHIPIRFMFIIKLNPFYYFIKLFRAPLYFHTAPNLLLFAKLAMATTLFWFIVNLLFKRMKNQFITSI